MPARYLPTPRVEVTGERQGIAHRYDNWWPLISAVESASAHFGQLAGINFERGDVEFRAPRDERTLRLEAALTNLVDRSRVCAACIDVLRHYVIGSESHITFREPQNKSRRSTKRSIVRNTNVPKQRAHRAARTTELARTKFLKVNRTGLAAFPGCGAAQSGATLIRGPA